MENFVKDAQNKSNDNSEEKVEQPIVQDKPDPTRVKTVVPGNESGDQKEAEKLESSNKGQGPAGENL